MHKSLIGLAAAASIGLATMAAPSTANAYCLGCAVGAGVLGGVVAGAIVGSAIANSPPPPPPPAAYYPPPPPPPPPGAGYPAPPPAYAQLAPGCHWAKRRVWVEGEGYRVRTLQVCP
jgi:anaerobic selenocysteine-containing dehydrogenase